MTDSPYEKSLYQRMKDRGVNMSWYERGKHGRTGDAIPLDDKECSSLSIYLLKKDGSLWTLTHSGAIYHKVRPASKELPKEVYICVCCKKQWDEVPADERDKLFHPGLNAKEEASETVSKNQS